MRAIVTANLDLFLVQAAWELPADDLRGLSGRSRGMAIHRAVVRFVPGCSTRCTASSRSGGALADGVVSVDMALNEVIDAKAPSDNDFETETAAEIFADIVEENIDTVKKSFSGLIGKGRIAVAFKNAEKDDVNHQHDGHTKVRTNKL